MKLGLIGFGRAGGLHCTAAREVAAIESIAVCDSSPACRTAAAQLGLPTYETVADLLLHAEIGAAIICTPPAEHVPAALACLTRGIHVLCEKPLALRSSAARALFEAAGDRSKLALASKFRHVPEVQRAKHLAASGVLGTVQTFHISFCSPVDMTGRWNSQPHLSGGGVIADNAGHVFDVAMYLFGALTSIKATSALPSPSMAVEDSAALQIHTAGGITGSAEISWSRSAASDAYLTITGSNATLEIGWRGTTIRHRDGSVETFGGAYDRVAAHRNMHVAFCDAIAGHSALWITAEECLTAVAAVEASYRSLASGSTEMIASTTKSGSIAKSDALGALIQ